jgi:hypothetical protein
LAWTITHGPLPSNLGLTVGLTLIRLLKLSINIQKKLIIVVLHIALIEKVFDQKFIEVDENDETFLNY